MKSMKRIKIELTPEELATIIHLVGEKEKEIYNLSLIKNNSPGLTKTLTANLTNSQKEATIKIQLKAAISRLTGIAANQIKDSDSLTGNLHLTSQQIRSLAIPFSYIASQYKTGVIINPDDCEAQGTIQDCADLIMSKI